MSDPGSGNITRQAETQAKLAGFAGSTSLSNDTLGARMLGLLGVARASGGNIVVGTVVRSGGGTYDCTVYVEGREVGCTILQPTCSSTFGYSMGAVPIEGTKVVVLLADKTAGPGFIVGVVPGGWFCEPTNYIKRKIKTMYPWERLGLLKHRPYIEPITSPKYPLKVASTSRRPADILPGEWVNVNEHYCGFIGEMFTASMVAGGSYINVERLDDTIKFRSTNMVIWTDHHIEKTFIDDGYISREEKECAYQAERMGEAKGSLVLTGEPGTEGRPRLLRFGGFLAGVDSRYAMRPRDAGGDEGVYREHVSESGKASIRAGGGISIERYDSIPLVHRSMKASDPLGDHPLDIGFKPNTPFNYAANQHVHPMELYDAVAWDQKNIYRRFDEHKKDWSAQQEGKVPKDDANDPPKSREKYEENKNRRAGLFIGNDGSVTIRDAFGDEIVLNGGAVYINTPGSVVITAHKHFSAWAGRSAVVKADNGIAELSSEGEESRTIVSGVEQVNILAGSDGSNSKKGGVIIEAKGEQEHTVTSENGPMKADVVSGVVIKSEKSGVAIGAKSVSVASENDVSVIAGRKDAEEGEKKSDGRFWVAATNVKVSAEEEVCLTTPDAFLHLNGSSARIGAKNSVESFAGGSNTIVQNYNERVVTITNEMESGVGGAIASYASSNEKLQERNFAHYTLARIQEIYGKHGHFTDYMTTDGSEGYMPQPPIKMYQPFWHLWHGADPEHVPEEPYAWCFEPARFNGTLPFPGDDAITDGRWVSKNTYVNLDGVYTANRDSLKDTDKETIEESQLGTMLI